MSTSKMFDLEQNESYALVNWNEPGINQLNYEELENDRYNIKNNNLHIIIVSESN